MNLKKILKMRRKKNEIKNAPNDLQSMAQDGDAILRSLQNKSLPIVDLMVRESLQNSLDATLPESSETIVDFTLEISILINLQLILKV